MRNTLRHVAASFVSVDWSRFEGIAALRCALGVAIPLVVGVATGNPTVGVFGSFGALGTGFGSFQGVYRSRASVMLVASVGMAFSVLVGSLAGHSLASAIGVPALWALVGGSLLALGQAASFVGLQSIIAVVVAGGFPSDAEGALARAAFVFCGGLIQTLLVVLIWPLRRFAAERRSVAAVYRSLAGYASAIPEAEGHAPEPHTLAVTPSPLVDPQPFARLSQTLVFQGLLDEAERIRASLAAFAVRHHRLGRADRLCADDLSNLLAQALAEIASALAEGRTPRAVSGLRHSLADCAKHLPTETVVELLLSQVQTAWRAAGELTRAPEYLPPARDHAPVPGWRPDMRDALITLRANLNRSSTVFRHALRMALTLAVAAGGVHLFQMPRGYWVLMTVAIVLKAGFRDTFAFSVARVGGTALGAASATLIASVLAPDPIGLIVLILGFVWGGYALAATNYVAYTICITGYVVFVLTLAGVPGVTAAMDRIVNTAIGGALALSAYAIWPTWTARELRGAVAAMLEGQSQYVGALLSAYARPAAPDMSILDGIRRSSRLARSNSEAVIERMLSEPRGRHAIKPRTAVGLLAAARRIALAALALHAGLERDDRDVAPAVAELGEQVASGLLTAATAVREASAPLALPPLRQTQLALGRASNHNEVFREETDLIVDSLETIADLLRQDSIGDK